MFARILEFTPKFDKKEELIKTVRMEVLPILKKQPGFLELVPFVPEIANEKAIFISLWHEKYDAEKYVKETYAKVEETVRPFLATPITAKNYTVETKLCEHLVEALTAAA